MPRPARENHRNRPRLGAAEDLEPRLLLSSDGLAWGNAPYLSLSFVPDGTNVAGRTSRLFAEMDQIAEEPVWQAAIVSAFQAWSVNTNSDIAVVEDSGDDLGAVGAAQRDERFGDVRIGAIPMDRGVYAVAVSRGFVAGTWSGDVLFNSRVNLQSVDEVFRVALHEAGHVFGMEDVTDVNSPMFSTGLPAVASPSPDDLDLLHARFGERKPDLYDLESTNDTKDEATRIRFSASSDGYDGSAPLIVHADIGNNNLNTGTSDVDVYRFDPLDGYNGSVTFRVRTSELSQLNSQITVRDDSDNLLGMDDDATDGISVNLPQVNSQERYYIYVSSGSAGSDGTGGYALITTFDDTLQSSTQAIEQYSGPDYRFLDQDEIQDIFQGDPEGTNVFLGDDLHLNDTLLTATVLTPVAGFARGAKYEAIASISDATDVDYYQIRTADFSGGPNVMSILVESLKGSGILAEVTVFDELGNVVPHQPLVRHNGRVAVQLAGLDDDRTLFVRIQTSGSQTGTTGNYRLATVSGADSENLVDWVSSNQTSVVEVHNLIAEQEQLVFLAFAGRATNSNDEDVMVSLISPRGQTIPLMSGPANEFHSVDSLLLRPGTYRVEVRRSGGGPSIDYDLQLAVITDPLAVPRKQTVVTPHTDPGFKDDFVFPDPPPQSLSGVGLFSWVETNGVSWQTTTEAMHVAAAEIRTRSAMPADTGVFPSPTNLASSVLVDWLFAQWSQ